MKKGRGYVHSPLSLYPNLMCWPLVGYDQGPIHLGNSFDPTPSTRYIVLSVTSGDVNRAAGEGSNNIYF